MNKALKFLLFFIFLVGAFTLVDYLSKPTFEFDTSIIIQALIPTVLIYIFVRKDEQKQ